MVWHDGVKKGFAVPVIGGLLVLVAGFGGFGTWAAVAPLEGAVVSPGKVVAAGLNKLVQHLEGGIVDRVLVSEGQQVRQGEPVMLLDGTAAKAQVERLQLQLAAIAAIEARATAERDGAGEVAFPPALADSQDPRVAQLVDDQRSNFESALRKHRTELAIFEQQITALDETIVGHDRQREAIGQQIALAEEERTDLESLLDKGLTRKGQVLELKRAEADLRGKESQLLASAAEAKRSIAEIRERMERLKDERVDDAAARLADARIKRSELVAQLKAAADVAKRLVVTAPAAGTVMDLAKYHSGTVIAPGEQLMKIVPHDAGVLVEAMVRPQDIEQVAAGGQAWVRFPALRTQNAPAVPARVVYVSPDRIEDQRTGQASYLARLELEPDAVAGFDPASIGPGQSAEVYINTGERTFLDYLTEPLTRVMHRAARES